MASENNDDAGASGFIGEWGGAVLVLIVLVVMVVVASTGSLQGSGPLNQSPILPKKDLRWDETSASSCR